MTLTISVPARIPIARGQRPVLLVTLRNDNQVAVRPRFNHAIKRSGAVSTWQGEGTWLEPPISLSPNASVVITVPATLRIPDDWGDGVTVSSQLVMEGVEGKQAVGADIYEVKGGAPPRVMGNLIVLIQSANHNAWSANYRSYGESAWRSAASTWSPLSTPLHITDVAVNDFELSLNLYRSDGSNVVDSTGFRLAAFQSGGTYRLNLDANVSEGEPQWEGPLLFEPAQ